MRYVIVCLIKGAASDFHEHLVSNICTEFKVKRQKLAAHFTIKAPFETDNIEEIEKLTEEFCQHHKAYPISIKDFDHFRDAVAYMNILPSKEAVKVHDEYIDELKKVTWLEWKRNEGKGRVFHCTLVSKLPSEKFTPIWNYINSLSCNFQTNFDNITILRWERDGWKEYKEFSLIRN